MRTFTFHIIFFLAPLIISVLFITYLLWSLGEFKTIDEVTGLHQTNQSYLLGKKYIPFATDPKFEILRHTSPTITTLGNSRVLQVKKEFFKDQYSFYNLGQTNSIGGLTTNLERIIKITDTPPQLIIVALEQSYFIQSDHTTAANISNEGVGETNWLVIYTNVVRDLVHRKISLENIYNAQSTYVIGAEAALLNAGYREDGSRKYSDTYPDHTHPLHEDFEFSDTKRRILQNINLFSQAVHVNPERLDELDAFLKLAKESNIEVVLFFPPYAPSVYAFMQKPEFSYAYQREAADAIRNLTQKYTYAFDDFSDPTSLNLSDQDFYDGFHPKEQVLRSILLRLSSLSPALEDAMDR